MCTDEEQFIALKYDSFNALNSESECTRQNFDCVENISKSELRAQIGFDLCIYYLHSKKYELGRQQSISCRNNLAKAKLEYVSNNNNNNNDSATKKMDFKFCTINETELSGYLLACGIVDDHIQLNLMHKLNESSLNQYKVIITIIIIILI